MKIEIFGLRLPEIKPGDDLVKLIIEGASQYADGLKDGDILVITSKIISKAYGFLIKLDDIKPSPKAIKIAQKINEDARFVQAILDNSDEILFVVPFLKLIEKGLLDLKKLSKNIDAAYEVLQKVPYLLIVYRDRQIYSDAGLDFSNNPQGIISIPPKDLDGIAKNIRDGILKLSGKDIAVIITDTEMWFSFGSLDFARGSSGIEVISKKFGELDLYGKPKFGGVDHIAHEIACASALLIGQTNEGIPAVIVRGYKYNKSEEKLSDYQLRPETIIMIIREIIKSSIKVLGLKSMLKLFIKLFKP
jgi:coenzyme F420-0:L-glutamate ligase/coenzyme F420-1:gamma-L-glutamate ligase